MTPDESAVAFADWVFVAFVSPALPAPWACSVPPSADPWGFGATLYPEAA